MLNFLHPTLLAVAILCSASACTKKKTAAEQNAERAKAWQEQQKAKAVKYYHEIEENYPDSPYAAQARERIQAIGPVATPKATPAQRR